MNQLKLAILVTWHEQGQWDLYQELKQTLAQVVIFQPFKLKRSVSDTLRKLAFKLTEFYISFLAFRQHDNFHAVFSWSMRTGIYYGLINRFCNTRPRTIHVLRDLHFNLTRNDIPYRLRRLIFRLALPGIDYFLCTSKKEEEIYCRMFNIERSRICFFPDSPALYLFQQTTTAEKNYIFAYGNSDRDFDTLVKAGRLFAKPIRILSQQYMPAQALPDNIELITRRVSFQELIALTAQARMVVLPLEAYEVAAGQNTMIETMALGRPLIVTANLATTYYARHGESALFFEPQDAAALARHMRYLWQQPESAADLGRQAKIKARACVDDATAIFYKVLEDLGRL